MELFQFWENPQLQRFIHDPRAWMGTVGLVSLVAVAFFAIKRLRPTTETFDINGEEFEHNFEELCREGVIDQTELRKIRSVLGNTQGTRPGSSAS